MADVETKALDAEAIIAGIEQFGLAPDGSDLRDLRAAFVAARATPATPMQVKLERSVRQWAVCQPKAIIAGSEAQVFYALTDAKHDVLVLHAALLAERARAEKAERELYLARNERDNKDDAMHEATARAEALKANRDRLREALEAVVTVRDKAAFDMARAALEAKEGESR